MQLQRDKVGYLLAYGIAPFFEKELSDKCNKCEFLVVGFDESLNKVAQKQQMDINVRFWDEQEKQISMDGPNVNLKFLKDFKADLNTDSDDKKLLDLGSCGLHTLHCAFKSSMQETGWNIVPFLRAVYNLFKDSPARRALFTSVTTSSVFPKKFCAVQWLQNAEVAQRAIELIPMLMLFVEEIEKTKTISSQSYKIVSEAIADPLLSAKLEFFRGLASDVEPFLEKFQSDEPLVPFLYEELSAVLMTQISRIVKPGAMDEIKSLKDLKIPEKNILSAGEINIGIATKHAISKVSKKMGKTKDSMILKFRESCRKALIKFISKMLEKSPIHLRLTKAASCLDPNVAENAKRFDNDYTKRHTNLKHPELEQQNRVVPVLEMGAKKRKNPWEIVVSKVPRHDVVESINILQTSSAKDFDENSNATTKNHELKEIDTDLMASGVQENSPANENESEDNSECENIDENSNATSKDHDVKEIDTDSMYSRSEESSISNDSENDSKCEDAGILGAKQNSILVLEKIYIPPGPSDISRTKSCNNWNRILCIKMANSFGHLQKKVINMNGSNILSPRMQHFATTADIFFTIMIAIHHFHFEMMALDIGRNAMAKTKKKTVC
ncbi:hypothetical protein AVEN_197640-1 [Araneus ventricosus]|uniref:Uncharacterized protein n=1 Tax=Araneus ventricosus TaxID=182803 RepID=A0A4Y2JF93_ARAVE|nr:hypothetical protein AVEN_197640-1 [Araneus ventricosus]